MTRAAARRSCSLKRRADRPLRRRTDGPRDCPSPGRTGSSATGRSDVPAAAMSTVPWRDVAILEGDGPRHCGADRRRFGPDSLEHRPIGPGHQQRVSLRHDPGGDGRRLLRCLAQPSTTSGSPAARRGGDPRGQAQILEGLRIKPAANSSTAASVQLATGHTAQNRADFGGCHRRKNRLRSLISLTLPALKYNHLIIV
jgi:hypothetical protein